MSYIVDTSAQTMQHGGLLISAVTIIHCSTPHRLTTKPTSAAGIGGQRHTLDASHIRRRELTHIHAPTLKRRAAVVQLLRSSAAQTGRWQCVRLHAAVGAYANIQNLCELLSSL